MVEVFRYRSVLKIIVVWMSFLARSNDREQRMEQLSNSCRVVSSIFLSSIFLT